MKPTINIFYNSKYSRWDVRVLNKGNNPVDWDCPPIQIAVSFVRRLNYKLHKANEDLLVKRVGVTHLT